MAETLAPIPLRSPRPGEGGQRNDSSVYKPSRGFALSCVAHTGTNTDPLEQWAVSLHEGDPPTGDPEHRRRPVVQGCANILGMDAATAGHGVVIQMCTLCCTSCLFHWP